jgi:hypothetical protein
MLKFYELDSCGGSNHFATFFNFLLTMILPSLVFRSQNGNKINKTITDMLLDSIGALWETQVKTY